MMTKFPTPCMPDEQERHTGILEGLDDFGGLRLRNRKVTTEWNDA